MSNGITGLRGYQEGDLVEDPEDGPGWFARMRERARPPMTVTAEGVPVTLDAPERGLGRFTPTRMLRNSMGGLAGLGIWEAVRDRLARGTENADFGPTRALGVLPESVREQMANTYDERRLTADDLPGNVHDFAKMIAGQALTGAGPGADINRGGTGTHIPYPTQGFAAEHFDPSLVDRLVGKIIGTDIDADAMSREQYNEAFGFMEPSGWGATFGQGTMYEDPEGNIHFIDRYNFPNMTAGQVPGRKEDTSTQFSDYARGLGPHDSEQYDQDIAAFLGEVDPGTGEKKPFGRRMTNVLRHHMSEFGSTETDPTEGRSWDINLGPREELLAAYTAALENDPQPSRLARGLGWLRGLGGGDRDVQVAEAGPPRPRQAPVDELASLKARLGGLDPPGTLPGTPMPNLYSQ